MGRAKMLKQLRKEARRMPMELTKRVEGRIAKGSELLKQGVVMVDGKDVEPNGTYQGKVAYQAPVNHLRQMKKAYAKKGVDGVVDYMDEVRERAKPKVDPAISYVESQQTTPQVVSWPGM